MTRRNWKRVRANSASDTLAALTNHLQQVSWHHANVVQHANPELEF